MRTISKADKNDKKTHVHLKLGPRAGIRIIVNFNKRSALTTDAVMVNFASVTSTFVPAKRGLCVPPIPFPLLFHDVLETSDSRHRRAGYPPTPLQCKGDVRIIGEMAVRRDVKLVGGLRER